MDTGVGHQVGLELSEINVEGAIESQGGGDGGNNLTDQPRCGKILNQVIES